MAILKRRKTAKAAPRHTHAGVRAAQAAAEAPVQPVPDDDTGYDHPGWDENDAAPDATMVWRIPDPAGGPGFVIPPGLPQRTPGAEIPPASVPALRTEGADLDLLRDLRDALKALPGDPAPARPVAWLRVIEAGSEATEALSAAPEFAGTDTLDDGTFIAGAFLGIHGEATWLIDTVDPDWCDAAIAALTAVRDALVAAQDTEPEGEAAA